MNILSSTTFTWWQLGLLKWAVFLIGIAVGAHWSIFFSSYIKVFVAIGLLMSLYLLFVWKKQHQNKPDPTSTN